MVLASKLKYRPLIEWVEHELNGYKKRDTLPDYRRFRGEIVVNHVTGLSVASGQRLPYIEGLEDIREMMEAADVFASVDQMWSMKDRDDLIYQLDSDAIALINHAINQPYTQVTDAYIRIPSTVYSGILSTVRNRVLSFVLQIEDEFPEGDVSRISIPTSTRVLAERVFNTTIINRGTVAIGNEAVNVNQVEKQIVIGDIDSLHAFLQSEGFDPEDFPELDEVLRTPKALEQARDGQGPVVRWAEAASKKVAKDAGNVVVQTITQIAIKAALAYAGLS